MQLKDAEIFSDLATRELKAEKGFEQKSGRTGVFQRPPGYIAESLGKNLVGACHSPAPFPRCPCVRWWLRDLRASPLCWKDKPLAKPLPFCEAAIDLGGAALEEFAGFATILSTLSDSTFVTKLLSFRPSEAEAEESASGLVSGQFPSSCDHLRRPALYECSEAVERLREIVSGGGEA